MWQIVKRFIDDQTTWIFPPHVSRQNETVEGDMGILGDLLYLKEMLYCIWSVPEEISMGDFLAVHI